MDVPLIKRLPKKHFFRLINNSKLIKNLGTSVPRGSIDLYLYEVEINIQNPFKIRDFKYGNHNPLRLVDQLYYTLKAISSEERDKVFDALLGGEISAMNEIVRIVNDKGYDGFVYVNKHEDIGSLTWMNFYPSQVKILKVSHIEKDA